MSRPPAPAPDSAAAPDKPVDIRDASAFAASRALRDARLNGDQAETHARFAPYLSAACIGTAVLVACALRETTSLLLLLGWLLAVVAVNWFAARRADELALLVGTRLGPPDIERTALIDAVGRAAIWASLPATAAGGQPFAAQVVLGGAIAAMMVASLALIAVPRAAYAWLSAMTAALASWLFFSLPVTGLVAALPFVTTGVLAVAGVSRLTRWSHAQLSAVADERTRGETVTNLLNEYEQRGVGWLWQIDAENRVSYISSRMSAMLGRSNGQMLGHSLPATLGGSGALGQALLARQPFAQLEMEIRTSRGPRWISLSGDPIAGSGGEYHGYRGVGADITDVRQAQQRLTNLANMDVLSGLPNRGRMRQLLGEALEDALATNISCAVMFLDLDGFKPVNDTFGHPKGDMVLKAVARRLAREVGGAGSVGRLGGDEFAVVIRDAQSRRAMEDMAARIIAAVAEPYMIDGVEIRIGASIGCAFGPIDGTSVDDLIQKADLALYEAKAQGRGICRFFSRGLLNEAEDRLRLEQDLRLALKLNQFQLLYQPLVNAQTQMLTGFEALIRWNHPTRGVVSPLQFIPLAEETGLIVPIGEWVVHEAAKAAASWPEEITVAVNLSPKQLTMPACPNIVSAALTKNRLQANRLELEVTESVFLGDSQDTLDVLKRLRGLGVGIALDDFGTGYSSLGYLNKAVFHKLKIDGSFVRAANKGTETIHIIEAIVMLAKSFRMTITAEGIETVEDFVRMRDLGCHQMQGYLFGRPMAYERATALVRGENARAKA